MYLWVKGHSKYITNKPATPFVTQELVNDQKCATELCTDEITKQTFILCFKCSSKNSWIIWYNWDSNVNTGNYWFT